MPGLATISQNDFSGGRWSTPTPERIPANGVARASNALVDDTGGLYRRGGVTNFAGTGWPTSQIKWVWQGTLAGGNRTLFATASNLYSINGSTITSVGATTSMSAGANRPAVLNGFLYLPGTTQKYDGTTLGPGGIGGSYAASIANRLVNTPGSDIVQFSGVGGTTFAPTDFWKLPGGLNILGLAALRDSLIVFTDQGVWVISNMALNLTDPDGNVQQRLDLYSPDMVLWGTGSAGVVGYHGGLIVPGRDGVWLMRLGVTSDANPALQLLSGPITSLYHSYVTLGFQPGQAAVFAGHYFLPILSGNNIADFLVCRIDLPSRPWTGFVQYGAAYAVTPSQDGKTLIGGLHFGGASEPTSSQLATLHYLEPATASIDGASGNRPTMSIVTRDIPTGPLNNNTVTRLRVAYSLGGTTGILAEYGGASDAGQPTTLGTLPPTGVPAIAAVPVAKRTSAARFALSTSSDATVVRVKSLEVFVRQQGRR